MGGSNKFKLCNDNSKIEDSHSSAILINSTFLLTHKINLLDHRHCDYLKNLLSDTVTVPYIFVFVLVVCDCG